VLICTMFLPFFVPTFADVLPGFFSVSGFDR